GLQLGEADRPSLALRLALPVVGDLPAAPRLHVPVYTVEADVELAADVPLRVRQFPLEHRRERLEPRDALPALRAPELLELTVVDVGLRVRVPSEVLGRRIAPFLEEQRPDRLGHATARDRRGIPSG